MKNSLETAPQVLWPAKMNEVPKEIFVRADVFRAELQRIFYGPEWHPVGHVGEIPNKGDFKTFAVGEVPLLVARADDNSVRVFFNTCSHRGNQIETSSRGNRKEFECPYHRWLFDSKGDLIGCPDEKDFTPGFRRLNFALKQPRVGFFYGLIFVTFSDAAPDLDGYLENIKPTLIDTLGGDGRLRLLGYQKVRFKANWKAYAENDGYHAPLLHSAFRMLNWQGSAGRQYASPIRGHIGFESDLQAIKNRDFLKDATLVEIRDRPERSPGSRVVELFPTFVSTRHLDTINLRFAIARNVDETEVHYAYFSHEDDDEAMVRHRLRQSSNLLGPCGLISMEDAAVFQRIHIGNRAPGNVTFQKGVTDEYKIAFEVGKSDESGNLPHWEYYRKAMRFERQVA